MDPVIESIAKLVTARLEAVTASNGFETTIAAVARPSRTDNVSPSPNRAVCVQGAASELPELDGQGNPPSRGWRQSFIIGLFLMPSETETTALDETANRALADMERALMADPQWNGWALDSRISAHEWEIVGNGNYVIATVTLEVTYRIAENDPYVNRVGG